jgi:hypothetical protein
MEAAISMLSTMTFLLARFSWHESTEKSLKEALLATDGKPWSEATALLCDSAKKIIEQEESRMNKNVNEGDLA